jgi:hypothetical protein
MERLEVQGARRRCRGRPGPGLRRLPGQRGRKPADTATVTLLNIGNCWDSPTNHLEELVLPPAASVL